MNNLAESAESALIFDNFKPLTTIKAAFFQLTFACSLEVLAVALFVTKEFFQNTCGQINVLLFSQCALWLITFILDHYYISLNYSLRLAGHFNQYKRFNKLSSVFLRLVSFGNATILITLGILLQIKVKNICICDSFVSPTFIIFYIFSAEIVLLIPNLINYIVTINSFNNTRPLADIEKYECWFSADIQSRVEAERRLDFQVVSDFLEKQADLISYYKAANNDLCKRLQDLHNKDLHSRKISVEAQYRGRLHS